jgi:hypothetical protein
MRRLALLLATSLLGTGCYVSDHSNPPCLASSITVRWPSFLLADGGVTPSCATAGVSFVDVFMNDQPVQQGGFACSAGGMTITDVQPGSYRITVEGVASDGASILLRDELDVSPAACGDIVVDAQPAEGSFRIAYSFTPTNVCTSGGSFIWFSVYDQIARAVTAVADETANATSYVCGDTIAFAMPAGAYTLQRVEEAVPSAGTFLASAKNCNPTTFSVDRAAQSVVNVALADSTSFCP